MHMCISSRHMSSVPATGAQCYVAPVRNEQRIIADWMRRILARKGWTGKEWAERAGVNPSTVTRAMADEYESVTSIPTIDALARTAGVPSPLDALAEERRPLIPNADALEVMLDVILRDVDEALDIPMMARQLGHGLGVLSRNPGLAQNRDSLRGIAEALVELRHPLPS